jgi:hypothetical protein
MHLNLLHPLVFKNIFFTFVIFSSLFTASCIAKDMECELDRDCLSGYQCRSKQKGGTTCIKKLYDLNNEDSIFYETKNPSEEIKPIQKQKSDSCDKAKSFYQLCYFSCVGTQSGSTINALTYCVSECNSEKREITRQCQ